MSSLGYFFQINDYWTQAPVGSEGSACHNGLVVSHPLHGHYGCPVPASCPPVTATAAAPSPSHCSSSSQDLWEDDVPATGLNATAYEEVLFENHLHAALDSYAAPDGPRARGQPLFLHYAPHLIHDPYEVPAPWLAKFDFIAKAGDDVKGLRQVYAAMVNYMDTVVGNITAHMKALGLWNDTVVIGISDNGGPIQGGQGANNYPLRSGKFSSFEGGMRVNAFMGGGFLPPAVRGTATTQLMHVADLWGTLADATGQLIADPVAAAVRLPPLDTHSFWHSVVLQNRSAPPRPWLLLGSTYWEASGLKLHNGGGNAVWQGLRYPNASTNFSANAATTAGCDKRGCLYDVLADIGEHVDLAAARPAAMDRMVAARTAAAGRPCDLNSLRGKGTDPRACQAIDARGGYWGPWVN